jgi:hypothetical protein
MSCSSPCWLGFSPTAVGVILATTLPVALRRRYPMIVLITIGLATVGQFELVSPSWPVTVYPLGLMVALYTVAAYRSRRTSLVALVLVVGLTFLQAVLSGFHISPRSPCWAARSGLKMGSAVR